MIELRVHIWKIFILGVCFLPNTYANENQEITRLDLLHQLKAGGFNIYFRHAETDWSQIDQIEEPGDWTSCKPNRVRQLSGQGRENSIRVGKAIRALALPIGKVFSSPYCRAIETAKLMGIGGVEATNDIINLRVAEYFGGRNAVIKTARRLLATEPADGTNLILVGHGNVALGATEIYPEEAEGLVFRPDGAGGFEYITRLTPEQWERFATLVVQNQLNRHR